MGRTGQCVGRGQTMWLLTWRSCRTDLNHFFFRIAGFGYWFNDLTVHHVDKLLSILSTLAHTGLFCLTSSDVEETCHCFLFALNRQFKAKSYSLLLSFDKLKLKKKLADTKQTHPFLPDDKIIPVFPQSQEEDTKVKSEMMSALSQKGKWWFIFTLSSLTRDFLRCFIAKAEITLNCLACSGRTFTTRRAGFVSYCILWGIIPSLFKFPFTLFYKGLFDSSYGNYQHFS